MLSARLAARDNGRLAIIPHRMIVGTSPTDGGRAMIQARRLGHIVLKVRDARTSKEFYTRVLGLKVAHEDYERGAVFLSFGTQHHDLALFQLATGEAPATTAPG